MAPAPGQPLALAPAPPAPYPSTPAGLARDLGAITFERMHALFYMTDRELALAFCLDTAMGLIPSQAGAVLIYDPSPRELYLAVARGPRAASPHGVRVPVHEGLGEVDVGRAVRCQVDPPDLRRRREGRQELAVRPLDEFPDRLPGLGGNRLGRENRSLLRP